MQIAGLQRQLGIRADLVEYQNALNEREEIIEDLRRKRVLERGLVPELMEQIDELREELKVQQEEKWRHRREFKRQEEEKKQMDDKKREGEEKREHEKTQDDEERQIREAAEALMSLRAGPPQANPTDAARRDEGQHQDSTELRLRGYQQMMSFLSLRKEVELNDGKGTGSHQG